MSESTSTECPGWFRDWVRNSALKPENRGNVAALLVVLQRLRDESKIREELQRIARSISDPRWRGFAAMSLFVTKNEGQIRQMSGANVRRILRSHGVLAGYLDEVGGRSSRGNFRPVRELLSAIPEGDSGSTSAESYEAMQRLLISTFVEPAIRPDPIRVRVNDARSTREVLDHIMRSARARQCEGHVAQHLIGAKLATVFGESEVENHPVAAKDEGLGRQADFTVGERAYHVTVAKLKRSSLRKFDCDRDKHFRTTIFVPDRLVDLTKRWLGNADIVVDGIETYIDRNMSERGRGRLANELEQLRALLALYNRRVGRAERPNSGLEIEAE